MSEEVVHQRTKNCLLGRCMVCKFLAENPQYIKTEGKKTEQTTLVKK